LARDRESECRSCAERESGTGHEEGSKHCDTKNRSDSLAHAATAPTIALSVPQFTLAPHIVASTDNVSTMPVRLANRFSTLLDLAK